MPRCEYFVAYVISYYVDDYSTHFSIGAKTAVGCDELDVLLLVCNGVELIDDCYLLLPAHVNRQINHVFPHWKCDKFDLRLIATDK